MSGHGRRAWGLHLAVIGLLLALNWLLPAYHQGNLARIMVLALYATGYNILFGYAGLLSLGHAMLFASGMYAAGLGMRFLDLPPALAFAAGLAAGTVVAFALGLLALRTIGVAFMIVTLMFAQAAYLTILQFGTYTRGDEGFTIPQAERTLLGVDLTAPEPRYLAAWALLSVGILACLWLVRSRTGRVLVAIRENEERTRMLGYDVRRYKLAALTASGAYAGAAGAAYGILFGTVGASFATIQYSIEPLLFTLLGGAGTVLGPLLGSVAIFYLMEVARDVTAAYLIVVGFALILLVLFARKGLLGTLRERAIAWLP